LFHSRTVQFELLVVSRYKAFDFIFHLSSFGFSVPQVRNFIGSSVHPPKNSSFVQWHVQACQLFHSRLA
jgi:hypothetical protein